MLEQVPPRTYIKIYNRLAAIKKYFWAGVSNEIFIRDDFHLVYLNIKDKKLCSLFVAINLTTYNK